MPAKTAYFLQVTADSGVEMQFSEDAIKSIAATLGLIKMTKKGEPPAGMSIIGSGSQAALAAGGLKIAVIYTKNEKKQTAHVWIAPTKITNGMFKTLEGKQYRTYPINKALNIRHRVYV